MRIELQRVQFMPADLKPGVLYVSEEFDVSAHLCACGCGAKIRTPLGTTEWTFEDTPSGPTLDPSIGNWQQACQSHYWIREGEVIWAPKWTAEQIARGRRWEERRRREYYDQLYRKPSSHLATLLRWLRSLFGR